MTKPIKQVKAPKASTQIVALQLQTLNQAAISFATSGGEYGKAIYDSLVVGGAAINSHAQYLAKLPEDQGGGNSGTKVKALRAMLAWVCKVNKVKTALTIKQDTSTKLLTVQPSAARGGSKGKRDGTGAEKAATWGEAVDLCVRLLAGRTAAEKADLIAQLNDALENA